MAAADTRCDRDRDRARRLCGQPPGRLAGPQALLAGSQSPGSRHALAILTTDLKPVRRQHGATSQHQDPMRRSPGSLGGGPSA